MNNHFIKTKNPLKFVWLNLKQYPILLSCYVVGAFIWSLTSIVASYYLKEIIDVFSSVPSPNQLTWQVVSPVFFGFFMLGFVLRDGVNPFIFHLTKFFLFKKVKHKIRINSFKHTIKHSVDFLETKLSGSLAYKIMDLQKEAEQMTKIIFYDFWGLVSYVLLFFIMTYFISPGFLVFLILWSILYMLVVFFMTRKAITFSKLTAESRSYLVGDLVDSVSNNFIIKNFGLTFHEYKKFMKTSDNYADQELRLNIYIFKAQLVQGVLKLVLFGVLIPILFWLYKNQYITTGGVAFVMAATVGFEDNIYRLRSNFINYLISYGVLKQALEVIYTPHTIIDQTNANEFHVGDGAISFQNMAFSYTDEVLFENFNLEIKPRQKIALIGHSGGGKSTLVKLILRFYDLDAGRIMINDQNIADVPQEDLRKHISVIPQDTSLFHRSLIDNIRYGKIDASDSQVYEAARKAYIHDFIETLPNGYDTMVGERGVKLSGGQRQRIAIARAILKDAPILILDEATSALDSESEQYIQKSLATMMIGKTVIAIAHRLSTISHMDRIVVLDNGKIIEDGAHDDLLKDSKTTYAKLWSMQSGGFLTN